jgi:uncharacterized protein YhfF
MDSHDRSEFIEIFTARNKQQALIKKDLLEAHGIECSIHSQFKKGSPDSWGTPYGMDDYRKDFILLVPPEKAEEARALVSSAGSTGRNTDESSTAHLDASREEGVEKPELVLLDRDHRVVYSKAGFPVEAIEEAAPTRQFLFYGSNSSPEKTYQFFLSKREANRFDLSTPFSWHTLASVLEAEQGVTPPGEPSEWTSQGEHTAAESSGSATAASDRVFREAYCEVMLSGFDPPAAIFDALRFGPSPRMANRLGALVREGKKTATASLGWAYQDEQEPYPQEGDVWIVVDGRGKPLAVIQTSGVSIVPFQEVTAEHAAAEGEGDLSLEYWRKVHWKVFSKECRGLNREPDPAMPVVCERFTLLKAF